LLALSDDLCELCQSIAGQPIRGQAHDRQQLISSRSIDGALRHEYLCRFCGAQMFKLESGDLSDEVWTVTPTRARRGAGNLRFLAQSCGGR